MVEVASASFADIIDFFQIFFNDISKSGGRHLHHSSNLKNMNVKLQMVILPDILPLMMWEIVLLDFSII